MEQDEIGESRENPHLNILRTYGWLILTAAVGKALANLVIQGTRRYQFLNWAIVGFVIGVVFGLLLAFALRTEWDRRTVGVESLFEEINDIKTSLSQSDIVLGKDIIVLSTWAILWLVLYYMSIIFQDMTEVPRFVVEVIGFSHEILWLSLVLYGVYMILKGFLGIMS